MTSSLDGASARDAAHADAACIVALDVPVRRDGARVTPGAVAVRPSDVATRPSHA